MHPSHNTGMSGYGMSGYGPPAMSGYGAQRENDYYYQGGGERDRYNQYDRYAFCSSTLNVLSMECNIYCVCVFNNQFRYYQPNRYENRPGGAGQGYERNDYSQNYQDYRGNGYDNRDPAYFNSMRGSNRVYGNRENFYESYDGNNM